MVTGISGNGGADYSAKWLNNVFSEVDSNSDGAISQDEFQEAFSKVLEKKIFGPKGAPADIDIDRLFAKIDQDGDGSISKDEFADFIEERKKMPPPPFGFNLLDLFLSGDASDVFSEIDADGDGVISQAEFVSYIEIKQSASGTENAV